MGTETAINVLERNSNEGTQANACTGACGKCRAKRQQQISTLSAADKHIDEDEMHGVEFKPGKQNWSWTGHFKGTGDF